MDTGTNTTQLNKLRFPIGKFIAPTVISKTDIERYIKDIEELPALVRQAVAGLSEEQLNTPYRPGGWTIKQVVHHIPDSHINSYVRFKLALTEDNPIIKPYAEERWAELVDGKDQPVEISLTLLEALHRRWVILLKSLTEQDWHRNFMHPESGATPLQKAVGLYSWHGKHHLAHITNLRTLHNW